MTGPAKRYDVRYDDFYSLPIDVYKCDKDALRAPITQLIDRYGLHGTTLVSLGAGPANEEYWFWKYGGCRLVLVDIDESGTISPALAALPRVEGELTYIVDDARRSSEILRDADVLFFSSFTPDELHRGSQIRAGLWSDPWPPDASPFSDSVLAMIRGLNPGGLAIIQSYCGGPSVFLSRRFLGSAARQLEREGLTLLEAYAWASLHGVNLFAIFNGPRDEAARRFSRLPPEARIESIHGRGLAALGMQRTVRTWALDGNRDSRARPLGWYLRAKYAAATGVAAARSALRSLSRAGTFGD